jgi:hypothetical protein
MWINVMQKQHTLWNFNAEALRPWSTWMWYYNVGICSAKALHFVEFYVDISRIDCLSFVVYLLLAPHLPRHFPFFAAATNSTVDI